jgi:NADH-quinone oxidoreductase subunit M
MVQKDVKKLVAYSSVSHLGFVMLGLFAFNLQGIEGAILQMVNHGVSTGALFLIVGIIYERRHTRLISEFGGLAKVVPVFCLCFMVVTLSSIGVPGTNGFVGEFLILLGAFKVQKWYAVVAATGVIFAAVYMLWMFQRVMYGKITNEENLRLADMNGREVAYMLPLLLFILWIGIYPQPFLRRMDASVNAFVTRFEAKKQAALAGSPAGEPMLVRYFDVKKGGAR